MHGQTVQSSGSAAATFPQEAALIEERAPKTIQMVRTYTPIVRDIHSDEVIIPVAEEFRLYSWEERALAACRMASLAQQDYTIKAVIAGFYLMEYRSKLSPVGAVLTCGKCSPIHGRNQHTEGPLFLEWLKAKGLSVGTAYRWMEGAQRIAGHLLGLALDNHFSSFIEVDGKAVPLSAALTYDNENRLSKKVLDFRRKFFEFLADKSFSEAIHSVMDGKSPRHRITLAANGKGYGGTLGEDRKSFHLFAGSSLDKCLTHVGARSKRENGRGKYGGHWDALSAVDKQKTRNYLSLFIKGLPNDLVDFIFDAAKAERGMRLDGNAPQPLALFAAINKESCERGLKARRNP